MIKENYLIFRHSLYPNYRVPIDYGQISEVEVSEDDVISRLSSSLGSLKNATCFVSGGVDSSLMAAVGKMKVIYTAAFPGHPEDESLWAQKVADHIGAELRKVEITRGEYLASLEHLIRQKGDGLHPNEPCLYLVAKRARKDGFSTIASGEGADDIFGGYTDLLANGDKYLKDAKSFLERYAYVRPSKYGLKEEVDIETYRKWGMERFILEVHTPGLIWRAINACAAANIVPVFPYLVFNLPQLMWGAKKEQKTNKRLLKKVAERFLPNDVVYRSKVGFPVPLNEWLDGGPESFFLLNVKIWESFN